MNILLTGATGFIGSAVVRQLKTNSPTDDWFMLSSKEIDGFKTILHSDYTFSKSDFSKAGLDEVDVVLMLGGYIEKPGDNPFYNTRNNISSVMNALYLLNNLPNVPKKVIFCSTIAVYGFDKNLPWDDNAEPVKYTEASSTSKSLTRTYAIVKVLQERLVKEWCGEKQCKCQILRIGTVYGPNRDFYNFLGTCLRCIRNHQKMVMYAPPQQLWNYVYVTDIARWLMLAAAMLDEERTVNLISDRNYTTMEVLDIVKSVWPDFSYVIDSSRGYMGQNKAFDSIVRSTVFGKEEYDLPGGLVEVRDCDK